MIPTVRRKWLVVMVVVFAFPLTPAQATLSLDASLGVSEQYTDNLFFTFANKRDDFGTFVIPRVTLIFENKHVKLGGTYAATAQFYVNNDQANTVAHGLNFITDFPFLNRISKRLQVRVNESLNITPAQPGFSGSGSRFTGAGGVGGGAGTGGIGVGGGGVGGIGGIGGLGGNSLNNQGIFNQRGTTSFQNRARILISYNFTPRWDGTVQYSNTYRTFTSSALQDSMNHTIRTGVSFRISDITSINGGYRLRLIDFSGGSSTSGDRKSVV